MTGEFERIRRWLHPLESPPPEPSVILGNGDDALALAPTDRVVVISMDTLVEGTHILPGAAPGDMARRAMRSALSDLAAMGARPWFYTLSLVIPAAWQEAQWQELAMTLQDENERWQCPCLGGDTTRGPVFVMTVQVHGCCDWTGQAITRGGASAGDDLWLLGEVGNAAAGLELLRRGERAGAAAEFLIEAFNRPPLWFSELPAIAGYMSAAIDVSDGLLADIRHVSEASRVALEIDLDAVPLSSPLVQMVGPEPARHLALSGGDDYALAFTAPASARQYLQAGTVAPLARIGQALSEPEAGVQVRHNGQLVTTREEGYDHFS